MPDLYTRVGQLVVLGFAKRLREQTVVEVPTIGTCTIDNIGEPHVLSGNWLFTFDVKLPKSLSTMTLGVATFGSGLGKDVEAMALPEPDFVDPSEAEFPPEHAKAWWAFFDALEALFEEQGLKRGSSDDDDYYLIEDYYPSRGISGTLNKPELINRTLAVRCQTLIAQHSGWDFWIQFEIAIKDSLYNGKDERLLIREDRIVPDINMDRLIAEFPDKFVWQH